MADVSDNRFNVLRENDEVGDLDDSVSQAITTAVLATVEDSKTVKGTLKTSGRTRATTGNKVDGAIIGDIVNWCKTLVTLIWLFKKTRNKRRRFRAGCTCQDRKSCIHFPTAFTKK